MASWAPSPDDVAKVLRARLAGELGASVETFDESTRPTVDQVQDLIDTFAVPEVEGACGADIPEEHEALATRAATFYAASLVEASYFPEQANQEDSSYTALTNLFERSLETLKQRLRNNHAQGRRAYSVRVSSATEDETAPLSIDDLHTP